MRLRTIGVIGILILGLLAGPLVAEAQQAGKVYRIGWLRLRSSPPTTPNHVAFRQELRELGYVEGQNVVIEYRSAKGEYERYPVLAAELVRLKVDVIVVSGSLGMVRVLQQATRTIPIVTRRTYTGKPPLCAAVIQTTLRMENADLPQDRRMEFRIGINLGDVVVDGERLYGDGVNIAARMEALAEGGGICVSGTVFEQVKGKVAVNFEDLGLQQVKNIAGSIRAYRVVFGSSTVSAEP